MPPRCGGSSAGPGGPTAPGREAGEVLVRSAAAPGQGLGSWLTRRVRGRSLHEAFDRTAPAPSRKNRAARRVRSSIAVERTHRYRPDERKGEFNNVKGARGAVPPTARTFTSLTPACDLFVNSTTYLFLWMARWTAAPMS